MPTAVVTRDHAPDFGALTLVELRAEALRLAGVLDIANAQRKEILRIIERRETEATARQRLGAMTEVQKDALRSVLDEGRK